MVPRGVRGPGRPKKQETTQPELEVPEGELPRDQDAEDVERCAREHGGLESPGEEKQGERRQATSSHEDAPADKYVKAPPLPLGLDDVGVKAPVTPELKRPQTPRAEDAVVDEGEVEESRRKTLRKKPKVAQRTSIPPQFVAT